MSWNVYLLFRLLAGDLGHFGLVTPRLRPFFIINVLLRL